MKIYILFEGIYEDRQVKKVFKTEKLLNKYFDKFMRKEITEDELRRKSWYAINPRSDQDIIDSVKPDMEEHEIVEEEDK